MLVRDWHYSEVPYCPTSELERLALTPWPIACWGSSGTGLFSGADVFNDEHSPAMRRSKKGRARRDDRLTVPGPTVRGAPILMLADGSRAIEHLPPRVARRRPLPTTLLRRHDDEFHGDVHGTMGP